MMISFPNVGRVGLITDLNPEHLPEGGWSAAQNVRFTDGFAEKIEGHSSVFTSSANAFNATGANIDIATTTPRWMLPVPSTTTYWWMYCGDDSVYVTDGTTHFDISNATDYPSGYTTDGNILWNGGVIGGIAVINNGVDNPQQWTTPTGGTLLTNLTYDGTDDWATLGHSAKVIRPFKQFLVALDVTKAGVRYPRMVKWSSAAAAGSVPASWDETDATIDANETELAGTSGFVIDCLPLGETNMVYKEDSIWGMQYVGGNSVFRFFKVSNEAGILSRRCVKAFERKHIVLTAGDLIVHDGQSIQPILDNKTRRELFSTIDSTNYQKSFIAPNYRKNEMWICVPSSGSTYADLAYIWNWRDGTVTKRELPDSPHIAYGVVNEQSSDTWATDAGTWDADASTWDERLYNPSELKMLMSENLQSDFYLADDTNQFNGTSFTSYLQRDGLHFGEPERFKQVTKVYPRFEGSGTVDIYVGSQIKSSDPVTLEGPYTFTIGTDRKIDCRVTGRFISLRIRDASTGHWRLHNVDFEVKLLGRH